MCRCARRPPPKSPRPADKYLKLMVLTAVFTERCRLNESQRPPPDQVVTQASENLDRPDRRSGPLLLASAELAPQLPDADRLGRRGHALPGDDLSLDAAHDPGADQLPLQR